MAQAAIVLPILTSLRHLFSTRQEQPTDGNVIYLGLGALLGVVYSLGTEKFLRAMQHRHIFVRNSMLWLAAITWLFAVGVLIWVASEIYRQSGGGLEGFDRVLGVLIPFVVRADLIVDWAKRVSWALLNMAVWTQSTVQLRRLLSRCTDMDVVVAVDDEVIQMVKKAAASDAVAAAADMYESEQAIWTQDSHSLVRLSELLNHFEKLGRVAIYACAGFVLAIPGCIIWILYAAVNGVVSFANRLIVLGILYWLSIIMAPFGALILLLASAGLLCGVVTLSVVGTIIQFSVYWSTRTVYAMVRITLSQAWAGFPDLKHPQSHPEQRPAAAQHPLRSRRIPEEAGAAMACLGALLPSELEFALASWDGKHKDHRSKPIGHRVSRHLLSMSCFADCLDSNSTVSSTPSDLQRKASSSSLATAPVNRRQRERLKGVPSTGPGMAFIELPENSSDAENEQPNENDAGGRESGTPSENIRIREFQNSEMILLLLGRLGLDLRVKSPRLRRLSTYYSLGMLTQLQIDSGGNAWRLETIVNVTDSEFEQRIAKFDCFVAEEAKIAVDELAHRLRGSSKHRVVPTGYPNNRMVPVEVWLRSVLLTFLETASQMDAAAVRRISVGP